MPTIEIISKDCKGLDLNQKDFKVSIIEENRLNSHRSLFYDFLINQNGTIIHIGNPDFKKEKNGFYFAGQIVDWDFESVSKLNHQKGLNNDNNISNQNISFKFIPKYRKEINQLLEFATEGSPIKKVYFLTDYQFGPEKAIFKTIENINKLWEIHDNYGLLWNTLYEIN